MKCSVPDCECEATQHALISINNTVKARLDVCDMHADAAREDVQDRRMADHIDGYDRDDIGLSPDY